jgi:DNA polymerase-3 subunit gamma/tau
MENFVVSARKYRPQHFSTVVGQSHITTTLKNAILNQHLAHAFLFTGPRGVGKTTCARILAKTINCESLTSEAEACDICTSCKSFNAGASFNVHELDAASNNSVDDIRDLTDQVRIGPQTGRYKVYIIDEVHMLSPNAFNAFLKTLEEPPAHAIFILATTEKHKILPTILSRCQIFDFKRITPIDIALHLEEITSKENIQAEPAALQIIAQKSDGCMRDALSILDKIVSFTNSVLTYSNTLEHLNILDEDYFFKIFDMFQEQDLPGVLTIYDEIDKKGFEGDTVMNSLAEFFRNLLVSKDPRSVVLLQVVEDFKKKYLSAAASVSSAYLIGALNILIEAEIGFKQARNKKLHVEFHLIRLTHLKQAVTLINEGGLDKKKRVDEIKPVTFRKINFSSSPVESNKSSIATEKSASPASISTTPVTSTQKASLHIETSGLTESAKADKPKQIEEPAAPLPGLGSIKKIREQMLNRKSDQGVIQPLSEELLTNCWNAYLEKLQENGQVTSHTNLRMASVKIVDELMFEILAGSRIQQQFIENERIGLLSYIHETFNNIKIQMQILLDPEADKDDIVVEQTLSQKEQYFKMISLYPLVKELRDQLNLDLDY